MISIIVIFLIVVMLSLVLISKFSNAKWFCTLLGWHEPNEMREHDGLSNISECRRCQKRILQDSNGDWFLASCDNDVKKN